MRHPHEGPHHRQPLTLGKNSMDQADQAFANDAPARRPRGEFT